MAGDRQKCYGGGVVFGWLFLRAAMILYSMGIHKQAL